MSSSSELRDLIVKTFSQAELDVLCQDLDIDPEDIAGRRGPKSNYVADLIYYMERRGDLPRLIELVRKKRPNMHRSTMTDSTTQTTTGSVKTRHQGMNVLTIALAILGLIIAVIAVATQLLTPEIRCRLQLEACVAAPPAAVRPSPQALTDTPMPPTSAPTPEPTIAPTTISATSTSEPAIATVTLEPPQPTATDIVPSEVVPVAPQPMTTLAPLVLRVGCKVAIDGIPGTKIPVYKVVSSGAYNYVPVGEEGQILKAPADGDKFVWIRLTIGDVFVAVESIKALCL